MNTGDALIFKSRLAAQSPMKTCRAVSMVCRQVYVEVVGGAVLCKLSECYFRSALLMGNYLGRINRKCSFIVHLTSPES